MKKNTLLHFNLSIISFVIFALFFVSCGGSPSDEGDNVVTYIMVTSDGGNEKLLGKTFSFTVKDNLDNNITAQSQIFVNDQPITGNTYTPTIKGKYTVKAVFQNLPNNPIIVESVVNEGTNFKHRILYEEFTGTWCGYCTIGLARHDYLTQQTDDVVFMGIHGPQGTSDPWTSSVTTEMETLKNVAEWPTMYINRNILWPYDSNYTDMTIPLGQLSASSKVGIKINSTLTGTNSLSATAQVFFAKNYTSLKVAAFIVEDKLIHNQKNYISNLYGGASTIYNFEHHNVLRDKLTSVSGDAIPDASSVFSGEFTRNFQYVIPTNYNKNNLKIILMVLDENGTVLNIREEKIGVSNNYEFL